MAGTATNNLSAITNAEAADSANWVDIGGGQGSGQNLDVYIQGTESRSRKADNSTLGFAYDSATAPSGIGNSGSHVGLWTSVLQPGALSNALVCIGDSATPKAGNWKGFNAIDSTTWDATRKFYRLWVDPTRTADQSGGTFNLANCRNFGIEFAMGNISGNAHNVIIDSINYGTNGLTLTGGTSGSPATLSDLITQDATDVAGIINDTFIDGKIVVGGALTYWDDGNFALKKGYQPLAAADWQVIEIDNGSAATGSTFKLGSYFLEGIPFTVLDTVVAVDLGSGTLLAAPAMAWNTSVTFAGALVSSNQLTWGGSVLNGTSIVTTLDAVSALLCNTATNPDGYLDNMTFSGEGEHAIELGANTPAAITLRGHSYTGYNASTGSNLVANSGPTDAAIYNNSGKAITITVTDGQVPSVRNGAGSTTTIVADQITLAVTVLDDSTGLPIGTDCRVQLMRSSDKSVLINAACNTSGVASTTIDYDADTDVEGWAREMSLTGTDYEPKDISGQYTASGFSVTVRLKPYQY